METFKEEAHFYGDFDPTALPFPLPLLLLLAPFPPLPLPGALQTIAVAAEETSGEHETGKRRVSQVCRPQRQLGREENILHQFLVSLYW